MKYVKQFGIIMGITCLGELLNYILPFPVPGSIYGMVLLFLLLMLGIVKLEQVENTGDFLVAVMPVMFIPAAAGIIDAVSELQTMIIPILIVILPVTVLVMLAAGKMTQYLLKGKGEENE